MASRLMNEGPKWVIFSIWLAINIGLFVGFFFKFYNGIEWYYLNQILGLALPFARASAACLNFNCMLILLPVCRNLLSFVRGSICCCCKRNVRRQLDKNIVFHKLCAYMIVVQTAIHYYAHTYNIERYIQAHDSPNNATRGLLSALTNLPVTPNGTWLNPLRNPETNPMLEVVRIVPGYTGLLITIPLILIVTSATEVIRRSYFEVFWYTHHLFVIFFGALIAHGFGGLVRSQTNVAVHDPLVCQTLYKEWGSRPECPIPQFGHSGAQTWMWVIGPIALYLIERIIRFVRSQQKTKIVKVVEHPSRVLELQMQKKGFKAESGMYIFLHCPSISRLEWHPFTLTSSPQEDYFSVHIRLVGDWTNALAEKCKEGAGKNGAVKIADDLPSVAIDGPFGTASEDVYRYQSVMLVAAGIGVTPFASILKDIWYRYTSGDTEMKTQKIYFVWICPDTNAFEWFVDLLKSVENQMAERGQMDFLKYYLCLTRGVDSDKMSNILVRSHGEADPVTGLQQGTYYGKPDWDAMFGELAQTHEGTRIGVFFCGPKAISTTLHKMSNKHSSASKGTAFVYNKENF